MRKEQNFEHEVVGITEYGEIVTLDYVFKDDAHQGAVGSLFVPVSEEYVTEHNSVEYVQEYWESATGETLSEEDAYSYLQTMDGEFPGHDNSYCSHYDKIKEQAGIEAYTLECIGDGRCFSRGMKWAKLIRPDLWELIKEYEE